MDSLSNKTRGEVIDLYKLAQSFAKSELVGKSYKNQPDNVFLALIAAERAGVDPQMYMQWTSLVQGKLSIEAKLMVALLNNSGKIRGNVRYTLAGDGVDRQCTASVTCAATGETLQHTLTMRQAAANGWSGKGPTANSFWDKDPDLMLCYRAAARLIKLSYPEILMGCAIAEEQQEYAQQQSGGANATVQQRLAAAADQQALPEPAQELAAAPDLLFELHDNTGDN